MIHETIRIQTEDSLEYARLTTYLWEESPEIPITKRTTVLICPGGGYHRTSDREAEAIALKIMSMGHHAAVLRYSVAPARYPVALREVAQSVTLLRDKAAMWQIDENKIVVMGFSAGGHLAASYGVHWNAPMLLENTGVNPEKLKPNGLILGYPVITSEMPYRHEGSIRHLLGENWQAENLLETVSLEKHVGPHTPRTFLWSTFEDDTVPAENSLLFAQALMKNKIPVELHLYEKGGHGLSLAKKITDNNDHLCVQEECQNWIDLAETWLENV